MKIEQIKIPKGYSEAEALLEKLKDDPDIYAAYWPPQYAIEKYNCSPAPRLRPFAKAWNVAVAQGFYERIVHNLIYGHSALVRVE